MKDTSNSHRNLFSRIYWTLLEWEILGINLLKGRGSAMDAKIVLIKGIQEVLVSLGATFSYIQLE